jgi:hypothetical protein
MRVRRRPVASLGFVSLVLAASAALPQGASAAGGVGVTTVKATTELSDVVARCPEGSLVVRGGYEAKPIAGRDLVLVDNGADAQTAWDVRAKPGTVAGITAYARCASAPGLDTGVERSPSSAPGEAMVHCSGFAPVSGGGWYRNEDTTVLDSRTDPYSKSRWGVAVHGGASVEAVAICLRTGGLKTEVVRAKGSRATCPDGESVTGGGFRETKGRGTPLSSKPTADNQWTSTAKNIEAVCIVP